MPSPAFSTGFRTAPDGPHAQRSGRESCAVRRAPALPRSSRTRAEAPEQAALECATSRPAPSPLHDLLIATEFRIARDGLQPSTPFEDHAVAAGTLAAIATPPNCSAGEFSRARTSGELFLARVDGVVERRTKA